MQYYSTVYSTVEKTAWLKTACWLGALYASCSTSASVLYSTGITIGLEDLLLVTGAKVAVVDVAAVDDCRRRHLPCCGYGCCGCCVGVAWALSGCLSWVQGVLGGVCEGGDTQQHLNAEKLNVTMA